MCHSQRALALFSSENHAYSQPTISAWAMHAMLDSPSCKERLIEQRNSQPFPPVVHAWLAAPNSDLNVKHVPFLAIEPPIMS